MTADRLHDLVTRYYHGDLSPAEMAELSAALKESPAARTLFAELAVLETGLVEHHPRRPHPVTPPARRRWWPAAAATAAALLVAVAGWWALRPAAVAPPAAVVAEIESPVGDVRVGPGGGAVAGARVGRGQTVSTVGMTSGVTLRYPDGTRLMLAGDTTVTLADDGPNPRVVVGRGNLSATVPGDPMTIATPEAAVEAGHDAVVSVGRGANQTEVGVVEGTARVTDPAGATLMDMAGGDYGVVSADGTTRKDRLLRPGDEYRWHTDRPLPRGWELGRLAGGPGGPAVVPDQWDDPFIHRRCWQIRSESSWARGLFLMYPDTRVRVRYKVDRPGDGQLLVVVRPDAASPGVCNVMLAPVAFDPAPGGGWRTAELATADWVREEKPDRPPNFPFPWTAFLVVFNTYEADLGLQVAEFTVTRGPAPVPVPK